eukprot:1903562-Rhodomonas_salina.1
MGISPGPTAQQVPPTTGRFQNTRVHRLFGPGIFNLSWSFQLFCSPGPAVGQYKLVPLAAALYERCHNRHVAKLYRAPAVQCGPKGQPEQCSN